ncbi:hypothetical protein [Sporosarcina sp. E16_8]|nr:hypothetical protein [Sporosarcina sp. E16_8]
MDNEAPEELITVAASVELEWSKKGRTGNDLCAEYALMRIWSSLFFTST